MEAWKHADPDALLTWARLHLKKAGYLERSVQKSSHTKKKRVRKANGGRGGISAMKERIDYLRNASSCLLQAMDLRPDDAEAVLLYANTVGKLGAAIEELSHNPTLKDKGSKGVQSDILRSLSVSARSREANGSFSSRGSPRRQGSFGSVMSVLDDDDDMSDSSDEEEMYNVERFPLHALRQRAQKLFEKSAQMFGKCLRMIGAVERQRVYRDWGNMLEMQARGKGGLPADVLYDEASQKFEASLSMKPDTGTMYNAAFNDWGKSLAEQRRNLRVEDAAFFKGKFMQDVVERCLEQGSTEPMKIFMSESKRKKALHKELIASKGARGLTRTGSVISRGGSFDIAKVMQSTSVSRRKPPLAQKKNSDDTSSWPSPRFHPSKPKTRIRALSTARTSPLQSMPASPKNPMHSGTVLASAVGGGETRWQ